MLTLSRMLNINILHVNIMNLHVDINKLNANIIISHDHINILHVDKINLQDHINKSHVSINKLHVIIVYLCRKIWAQDACWLVGGRIMPP